MDSQVVSYRLFINEIELLREKALPGESVNQTAQRLMRELLGVSTESSTVSTPTGQPITNERIERIEDSLQSLQDCIQGLEARLNTLVLMPGQALVTIPVDSHVDSVDNILTQAELAKRLGVDAATLTKNRSKSNFIDWTRDKDPEGMAWSYLPELKRYSPALLSTHVDTDVDKRADVDVPSGWKSRVDEVVGSL